MDIVRADRNAAAVARAAFGPQVAFVRFVSADEPGGYAFAEGYDARQRQIDTVWREDPRWTQPVTGTCARLGELPARRGTTVTFGLDIGPRDDDTEGGT